MSSGNKLVNIRDKIYTIRGVQVMLDRDLAELYGVTTGNLNLSVKRNLNRFPEQFMFQLKKDEFENLILQNARSRWGGTRKPPYVFTEHGVLMLSSILKSEIAISINIKIVMAFVELRRSISINPDYKELHQLIKNIETNIHTRMDLLDANHTVDKTLLDSKMTRLSKENLKLSDDIRRVSDVLDEFENAYLIIKRPDDDEKTSNN